ncbi:FUSC family protein [Alloiococcus sp. CFN-8]|uniref:FUSC family protein n=1 Tax=Alloiococcus sp. CFN-8 TaxID=3416081 RepID=UPI003CED48AE
MKLNLKIGLRIYKTALAIFLCVVISNFFGISPFYPCIAAVISMESTVINSYKAGVNRMQGTFIGAIIGLVFSSIRKGNPFLISLGTIIIIAFCNRFKLKKSIVISNTVFIAIMINLTSKSPLEYSFFRLLDTLLGIVISVLVNYLVFAPKLHEKILEVMDEIKANILNKLSAIAHGGELVDLEDLSILISKYNTLVAALEEEHVIYRGEDLYLDSFVNTSKSLEALFIYLEALMLIKEKGTAISSDNIALLSGVTGISGEELMAVRDKDKGTDTEKEENIIFNYNLRKVIEIYNKMMK